MKMLIKESVLLMRDGKRVRPEIGKSFDLTDEEIKSIQSVRPQAIDKVPVVEVDPNSTAPGAKGKKAETDKPETDETL